MAEHSMPDHDLTRVIRLDIPCVISIIGAGGKTSLMFALAQQLADSERRVLCTTSTKIFYPTPLQCPNTVISDSADKLLHILKDMQPGLRLITAGKSHDPAANKVTGFSPQEIDRIFGSDLFDVIIVEADGAKRKPLKASNSTEPVFPSTTTHVVLVAGLDAEGALLEELHVHRAEIFGRNTGLEKGGIVTPEYIARGLLVEAKKAKAICPAADLCIFLNKADSKQRFESALQIIKSIRKSLGQTFAGVIGCLEPLVRFTTLT